MSKSLSKKFSYSKLLSAIQKEIKKGTAKAREALERQVLVTNWNVGRCLEDQLFCGEESGREKTRIINKLIKDLKRPDTYFYAVAKFYRYYPFLPEPTTLTWSHYRALITVDDAQKRQRFEQKAIRQRLPRIVLYDLILENKRKNSILLPLSASQKEAGRLSLTRGKPYHYKITDVNSVSLDKGSVFVDVGFSIQREVSVDKKRKIHGGHIIYSQKTKGESSLEFSAKYARTDKHLLYTYKAFNERVVDGDTLILRIDCGFRTWVEHRVRLRGIDCAEVRSSLGRKAKAYVERIVSKVPFLIIKTYKKEKYGRVLVDLFYLPGEGDPLVVASKGKFLNQELLDKRLAQLAYGT